MTGSLAFYPGVFLVRPISITRVPMLIRILPTVVLLSVITAASALGSDAQLTTAQELYGAGDLNGALERLEPLLTSDDLDQPLRQRALELADARTSNARGRALSPGTNYGSDCRLRSTNQVAARSGGRTLATRNRVLLCWRIREGSATVRTSPDRQPARCGECSLAFFVCPTYAESHRRSGAKKPYSSYA